MSLSNSVPTTPSDSIAMTPSDSIAMTPSDSIAMTPSDSVTMTPPVIPLELIVRIAHYIRDDDGQLRYGDFNAFLQMNRALYARLNRMLWKEAAEHEVATQRVFRHVLTTNNLARLEFFLELGPDIEVHIPGVDITSVRTDRRWGSPDIPPTPLAVACAVRKIDLVSCLLKNGANREWISRNEPVLHLSVGGKVCTTDPHAVYQAIATWIRTVEIDDMDEDDEDVEKLCVFLKMVLRYERRLDKAADYVRCVLLHAGNKDGWWWVCDRVVKTVRTQAWEFFGCPNLQFD